jgi:uncharacterized protein YndB with AHSA1/START domain
MDLIVNVENRILKPIHEVFALIVDPAKMAHYFISGASGPMKAGTTVKWEFADVGATMSVDVIEVEADRKVVFDWSASAVKTRVTIALEPGENDTTDVAIREAGWPMDAEGVKRAMGQNAGWTFTLCCLKAYMQHGINLRLGTTKRITGYNPHEKGHAAAKS